MRKTLVIDNGNSSTKVGIRLNGREPAVRVFPRLTPGIASSLLAEFHGFDAVAVCSVGVGINRALSVLRPAVGRLLVVDGSTPLPISLSGYRNARHLGPDRVAALCGARAEMPGKKVLVVDYGTAITYDLLLPDGSFAGGNIAPGTGMRMRALHDHTARLPLVDLDENPMLLGNDTDQAIRAGVLQGVAGELCFYRDRLGHDTGIIATGGASIRILSLLPFEVTHRPNLVLTGLKSILDYNENN